jgi:hypothetical protein
MKRIHPNARHALALIALAVSFGIAGCRGPSGGAMNPFLAPDRVPPPSTRAIAPGQAQPYYPGDPLPVMQSNAAPPEIAGNGLAWSAPHESAPPPGSPAATAAEPFLSQQTVAIPADDAAMRFAAPAVVEPAPFTPVAATPIHLAGEASMPPVSPASHALPMLGGAEPASASPWRTPQIGQPMLPPPPSVAQQISGQPFDAPPLFTAPHGMDVRLRAVASPPPVVSSSTAPRIRIPGQQVPQVASQDGFRPRSSMR